MNSIYIDFWLKNEVVINAYIDTNYSEEIVLEKIISSKIPYIRVNLRENGHLIAINKEEIACIEIIEKGESI